MGGAPAPIRTRGRVAVVALVAMVAIVAVPAGAVHGDPEPGEPIGITGEIDGLYPGAEGTLLAKVTNPESFAIRVEAVTVEVADAAPGCPASMLDVTGSTASVEVPPGGTATVPISVRMARGAPDGCQGVTFPLAFSATAVEASDTSPPGPSTTVAPPEPPGPSHPPRLGPTGADITWLIAFAVAATIGGAAAKWTATHRRP